MIINSILKKAMCIQYGIKRRTSSVLTQFCILKLSTNDFTLIYAGNLNHNDFIFSC